MCAVNLLTIGRFTYHWKAEQLFGFYFDRLVKIRRSLFVLFYFCSVLFSFCSLSVLLVYVCVCVVWCGYDKGPRYNTPTPTPTRSRRPDPEGSSPIVTLVPSHLKLHGRVQVPLVPYLSRSK